MSIKNTNYRLSTLSLTCFLLLALGVAWPIYVSAKANYENTHTPKRMERTDNRGWVYTLDAHIWVYTSAFAQRFGMPERWVDDSLQGVEAIAFKIVQGDYQTCGYGGNPEACVPNQECLFDFYIPKSADLPWKDPTQQKGFHSGVGSRSTSFLVRQDETDRFSYDEDFDWNTNPYAFSVGFDEVEMVGDYDNLKNPSLQSRTVHAREFDRTYIDDIDVISVHYCGIEDFNRYQQLGLIFIEPKVIDGKPTQYLDKYYPDIPVRHIATIPKHFMNQAKAYKAQGHEEHLLKLIQGGFQSVK